MNNILFFLLIYNFDGTKLLSCFCNKNWNAFSKP